MTIQDGNIFKPKDVFGKWNYLHYYDCLIHSETQIFKEYLFIATKIWYYSGIKYKVHCYCLTTNKKHLFDCIFFDSTFDIVE